ncbi:MAG: DUF2958 domain-containing protein [Fibrobacter sp.]|uniref:DUF2958 domain-containing protein n=1 Tax=Fibrobacter sp. TaxID=35828 RepID=UPI001B2E2AC0|nr:DUF2958 domain-containing protein [Fibrobacter sp.]MBO7060535.1 DUF2958 domain-containing protein [Fibrobacter sp.]
MDFEKLITPEIVKAIHETPYAKYDGVPNDEKKVIAHYSFIKTFPQKNIIGISKCHWFVLEDDDFDSPSENYHNNFGKVVFGAVDLGMGLELGSFSLDELFAVNDKNTRVYRDDSFEPLTKTMGEMIKTLDIEWMV